MMGKPAGQFPESGPFGSAQSRSSLAQAGQSYPLAALRGGILPSLQPSWASSQAHPAHGRPHDAQAIGKPQRQVESAPDQPRHPVRALRPGHDNASSPEGLRRLKGACPHPGRQFQANTTDLLQTARLLAVPLDSKHFFKVHWARGGNTVGCEAERLVELEPDENHSCPRPPKKRTLCRREADARECSGKFAGIQGRTRRDHDHVESVLTSGKLTLAPNAVMLTLLAAGGVPGFVDIAPATHLMDVLTLETAITPRIKAVVAVQLFGQCVDMEAVGEIAARHNSSSSRIAPSPSARPATARSAPPWPVRPPFPSIRPRYLLPTATAAWSSPTPPWSKPWRRPVAHPVCVTSTSL